MTQSDKKRRTYEAEDKRVFDRVGMSVSVGYLLSDRAQRTVDRGIARVVNLSQGGVMIESRERLDAFYIRLLVPVSDANDLEILGKIIHCEPKGKEGYRIGVNFIEGPAKMRKVAAALVSVHSRQKNTGT